MPDSIGPSAIDPSFGPTFMKALTAETLLAFAKLTVKTEPYANIPPAKREFLRAEVAGQFEEFAEYYAATSGPNFFKTNMIRPYEWRTLEEIGLAGKKVLDTACGDFYYWKKFFVLGAEHVSAFDISPNLVGIAKSSIDEVHGDSVNLWEGSLDGNIPLPSESIDVVTNFLSIHYLDEGQLDQFFLETSRVLKTGGKVVISTITPEATRDVVGKKPYKETIDKGEDLVVILKVPFGSRWIPTKYIVRGYEAFSRLAEKNGLRMAEPIEMKMTEEIFRELEKSGTGLDKAMGEVHRKTPPYSVLVFEKV